VSITALEGIALGALFGASLLLLVAALGGWRPHRATRSTTRGVAAGSISGRTWAIALGAGLATAGVTRWPVAAVAVGATVAAWPSMFGAARSAEAQLVRLSALATWTESLRDSIAGSIGLEEAIRHSLTGAPSPLVPQLERLVGRLRVQLPLPQALAAFAEDLEDASADLVVAALILNSRLRGPGLVATLSALAVSVREELDLRRRIEEGRKSLRRTALIILGATGVFAGGLTVLSRAYVAPYSSPLGQLVLAVVIAVFGAGLWWIRSATNLRSPERFLASQSGPEAGLRGNSAGQGRGEAVLGFPGLSAGGPPDQRRGGGRGERRGEGRGESRSEAVWFTALRTEPPR
jgi:tight adherence protein B